MTVKAGIRSAGDGAGRRGKEWHERVGGWGVTQRGAVSTLRERMFFACLPVAAWETERTTANQSFFYLSSSSFSFCPRPLPLFPFSFSSGSLFLFLCLRREASTSISILFLVLQWEQWKFTPECRWSKLLRFFFYFMYLLLWKSYCVFISVWAYSSSVHLFGRDLIDQLWGFTMHVWYLSFYCLSGLKRGCAHTALVCTVCIVAVTVRRQSYLICV